MKYTESMSIYLNIVSMYSVSSCLNFFLVNVIIFIIYIFSVDNS